MAIEHILTDADTIHGLAAKYGIPWQDIVEYNGLEYPYTLTSRQAHEELYANGYLKVTRELYSSQLTIYAGSTFTTETDNQGIQKVYQVTQDTIIPAGVSTGYVHVRCTTYGAFGNTIAGSIILPGQVNTNLGQFLGTLTVINEEPFTNGVDAKVLVTGQPIFIPESDEDISAPEVKSEYDINAYLNKLAGEDLAIDNEGDLMDDGFGDLASVVGIDNIMQACRVRLMTRKGSLPQHPEFGSDIHSLIGKAYLPYVRKLVELDVYNALMQYDVIKDVAINNIDIQGTSVSVDATVAIIKKSDVSQAENIRIQLDYGS